MTISFCHYYAGMPTPGLTTKPTPTPSIIVPIAVVAAILLLVAVCVLLVILFCIICKNKNSKKTVNVRYTPAEESVREIPKD